LKARSQSGRSFEKSVSARSTAGSAIDDSRSLDPAPD
jgi:hypothetical protein